MIPIVRKLTRYAAKDGQCADNWLVRGPCPGTGIARSSASKVMATANTPSLNASSLPLSMGLHDYRPSAAGRSGHDLDDLARAHSYAARATARVRGQREAQYINGLVAAPQQRPFAGAQPRQPVPP